MKSTKHNSTGVNLTHSNIVSEGLIPQYMLREWLHKQRQKDPNFSFGYRTLAHLPAAHIAGCQGYFVNPAVAGGAVYWMPKFDFAKFLEYNRKFEIEFFFTVPPIYLLIAKSSLVTDQFRSLKHAVTGAAPMGAELQALAESKLGCSISQTWGLSETTGSVTGMPWDQDDQTGSLSPLLPNARMRVVDDDENDVEEGQEGEFIVSVTSSQNAFSGWKQKLVLTVSTLRCKDQWSQPGTGVTRPRPSRASPRMGSGSRREMSASSATECSTLSIAKRN